MCMIHDYDRKVYIKSSLTGDPLEFKGFSSSLIKSFVASDGTPDSSKLRVESFDATNIDPFSVESLEDHRVEFEDMIARNIRGGFWPFPFKVTQGHDAPVMFVHKSTTLGERLSKQKPIHWLKGVGVRTRTWKQWVRKVKLVSEQLGRDLDPNNRTLILANQHCTKDAETYRGWTKVSQYGGQPHGRVMFNQPVHTFEDPNLEYTLSDLSDVIESILKGLGKTLTFKEWCVAKNLDPESRISVPVGDGSLYFHPDHEIWTSLVPESLRGMDKAYVNAVKVIGMRQFADTDTPRDDGIAIYHLGYHNDNRAFERKIQSVGYQVMSRATNVEDTGMYLRACSAYLDSALEAARNGDATALLRLLCGDIKVIDGKPYNGQFMLFAMSGGPLTYMRNAKENLKNSTQKRIGRHRVEIHNSKGERIIGSFRCYPGCDDSLKINEIALTRAKAREMHVRVGDTVIFVRSPFPTGMPLPCYKVVSTKSPALYINPVIWTLLMKGDFDGDTGACFPDAGVTACKRSDKSSGYSRFLEILELLFERNHTAEAKWNSVLDTASSRSTITAYFNRLDRQRLSGRHVLRYIVANALTAVMDNFVTRLRLAGHSDADLRVAWDVFPQVAVSGMKHGGVLVEPGALFDAVRIYNTTPQGKVFEAVCQGRITAFANLLSNRSDLLDKKIADGDTRDISSFRQRVLNNFINLDYTPVLNNEAGYERIFSATARKYFNEVVRELSEDELHIAQHMFRINASSRLVRRTNGPCPIAMMHMNPEQSNYLFYRNLNAPDCVRHLRAHGAKTEARNSMIAELKSAATRDGVVDEALLLTGLRLLYLCALGEPKTKSWLLWNHISDEHSTLVVNDIRAIVSRIPDTYQDRKPDLNLVEEVQDMWQMSSNEYGFGE